MTSGRAERLTLVVDAQTRVSGLLLCPEAAVALYVFAHGAGAGMSHPFMSAVADEFAGLGIASLRYQFPYMEKGGRRPDAPALCHAAVRSAVRAAADCLPSLPLFAGGKSFGGRMTSQTQALSPLPGVQGLVFLGFPLHPPKQASVRRAEHLDGIAVPMLFVQGSRDEFAKQSLLLPLIERLMPRATLQLIDGADHSLHVPARSGLRDSDIREGFIRDAGAWMRSAAAMSGSGTDRGTALF